MVIRHSLGDLGTNGGGAHRDFFMTCITLTRGTQGFFHDMHCAESGTARFVHDTDSLFQIVRRLPLSINSCRPSHASVSLFMLSSLLRQIPTNLRQYVRPKGRRTAHTSSPAGKSLCAGQGGPQPIIFSTVIVSTIV